MKKELNNIIDNCINIETSILDAMVRMDQCVVKVLFCVDKGNHLIGTVTDGDIRRAIINGASINDRIEIAIHKEVCSYKEDEVLDFNRIISDNRISAIPIVSEDNKIVKIYYESEKSVIEHVKQIKCPIVIMAGGQGKRLYPYTKILPKPLIPIDGIPIVERIMNTFKRYMCDNFYLIVNYKKNMIKAYFSESNYGVNIQFVDEDTPLGTGGGIKLLENKIDSTFVMTNCDILLLENLEDIIEHHKSHSNDVTMVCSLKNFEIPYGVVNISEGGVVSSFEEKPKLSFFTNTGYYIIEPVIMKYIKKDENISMPDIMARMKNDGKKIGVYPINENSWLDMGQFDSMESMEQRIKELEMK